MNDPHAQVAKLKRNLSGLRSSTNSAIKSLTAELEASEARNAWIAQARLDEVASKPIRAKSKRSDEGCFFLGLSDWHIGELVLPSDTHTGNQFDDKVETRRAEQCWANAVKLVDQYRRAGLTLKQAIVWIGGDMVTGEIHDIRTTATSTGQTRKMVRLLRSGLDHFLEEAGLDRVHVMCNFGNHGRIGEGRRITRGAEYSYEWLGYHFLADMFEGDRRVTWDIASNPFLYSDVWGRSICTSHGDAPIFGSSGGPAGPIGSVARGMAKLPKPADFLAVGHYHTYTDFGKAAINGSLKGGDEYAESMGFSSEEPQQMSCVMLKGDRPVWRVWRTPVICG